MKSLQNLLFSFFLSYTIATHVIIRNKNGKLQFRVKNRINNKLNKVKTKKVKLCTATPCIMKVVTREMIPCYL